MVRVVPIHFGVVLGCKGGGEKKQFFRSRTVSEQSYAPKVFDVFWYLDIWILRS